MSAEWVPLAAESKGPPVFVPEGYSTNENSSGGRLIVLAVDQPNIRFGGTRAITTAADAFIDRLAPSDRIAVIGFGTGALATPFTADRARVKAALSRMNGQKQAALQMTRRIALAEAQAIDRGDQSTLQAVEDRECGASRGGGSAGSTELCRSEIEAEAQELARTATREGDQTLRGLRDLLAGLKLVAAPKTLVLISEGFVLDDVNFTVEVGTLASAARTAVYALQLDQPLFDASDGAKPTSVFADRDARKQGLETLVSSARGTVVSVSGSGASFFDRLGSRAVRLLPCGGRIGSARSRRQAASDPGRRGAARRDGAGAPAVRQHRGRGRAAYAARCGDRRPELAAITLGAAAARDRVRTARTGSGEDPAADSRRCRHGYTAARLVSIGYLLLDRAGRVVDSQSADARIAPVLNGVPSPLQYTAGASVAPGDYTLKLAVAEGDKAGSVEHPIHAAIDEAGSVGISELMVGGPTGDADALRPTIGYTVSFGTVHGYLEAYASKMDGLTVRYEIAPAADGAVLASVDAQAHIAGERALFGGIVPVVRLPAGRYVMRAMVSNRGEPLATRVRPFEVAPPAVLMTSAEGASAPQSADAELFLPVEDGCSRVRSGGMARWRRHVEAVPRARAAGGASAFDTGAAMITAGDYPKAEAALSARFSPISTARRRSSISASASPRRGMTSRPPASGRRRWSTAGDVPQVYEWLGDALMRTHDLSEARTVYEEAVDKWPSDPRFTRPLALVDATFGRGREAVRAIERYLAASRGSRRAVSGVEWIYTVHAAGGVVTTARRMCASRKVCGRVREKPGPAGRAREAVDGILGEIERMEAPALGAGGGGEQGAFVQRSAP